MMRIQELRALKQITQSALAKSIGVSQGAIAHWESGDANPSADRLPAIANALSCTIDDLFDRPTPDRPA